MKLPSTPVILAGLGVITALAHAAQALFPPASLLHKVADKLLAVLPNVYDLLKVGPDAPKAGALSFVAPTDGQQAFTNQQAALMAQTLRKD